MDRKRSFGEVWFGFGSTAPLAVALGLALLVPGCGGGGSSSSGGTAPPAVSPPVVAPPAGGGPFSFQPQPLNAHSVSVTGGSTASGINFAVKPLTPTLMLQDAGTGGSANVTPISLARGSSNTLYLVGAGMEVQTSPGAFVSVSGSGVTVTQATSNSPATDGTPGIQVAVVVSSTASPGPRDIMVQNAKGELSVFVGGLIITAP